MRRSFFLFWLGPDWFLYFIEEMGRAFGSYMPQGNNRFPSGLGVIWEGKGSYKLAVLIDGISLRIFEVLLILYAR